MSTSPPAKSFDVQRLMLRVLLAMLPGIAVSVLYLGFGVLVNIALAALFASAFELTAQSLRGRQRPLRKQDGSVWVSAALIGLAIPPSAPWWIVLIAAAGAILLAKHAYGGLGQNIFNPAMAGYALVLVLFPAQLSGHWPAPEGQFDGYTMATALDMFKQNHSLTIDEWWRAHAQFGDWGGYGWEWINLAFLCGGLYLLQQKIFSWHTPVCLLVAMGLLAALFYDNGSSGSAGSPLYHWFSGATMLGAFFVATDPVTAPVSKRGLMLYGALIGALIFCIRAAGQYPDGVAFAVLLANAVTPLLDRLPKPAGEATGSGDAP